MSSTSTADGTSTRNTANTPSFQTWRQASGDDESSQGDYVQIKVVQSVQVPVDGPGIGVFEVSVENQPSGMRFEAGDILGSRAGSITNSRITPLYLPNPGGNIALGSIAISSGTDGRTAFTRVETVESLPLIAVESGKVFSSNSLSITYLLSPRFSRLCTRSSTDVSVEQFSD